MKKHLFDRPLFVVVCAAALVTQPGAARGQGDGAKMEWFNGRLEAREAVDVRPRVNGIVTKVAFRAGQDVKQGELLFEIDAKPYQIALEKAEAEERLADAKKKLVDSQLERLKTLADKGAVSREEIMQATFRSVEAEALVAVARANLTMARLNLDYTRIRSPIDGRIGQELVTVGNVVRSDDGMLAHIISVDPLRVIFELNERTLLRVQRALKAKKLAQIEIAVQLMDDAVPRKTKVDFVDNRVDTKTGGIRLFATIANPDRTLLPGMFVKVGLPLDSESDKK